MANPNYDTLLSTTLANYRRELEDNVFSARPLTAWLTKRGNIRMIRGGAKIVTPLIYGINETAKSYSGYDEIDTTEQEGITAAEYPWKQFAATVAISGIEEAMNNGDEEVIDLLEAKIMQAEETIAEKFDLMFMLDGTGNTGRDWFGLGLLVGNTGVVGGIDSATETWWRSYVEATAGALTVADLTKTYNTVSRGNDHPDLILTTQVLFEKYESLLQPQMRYTDTEVGDAGFQNLLFKGATMMFDANVPTGIVYVLNSKYIKLVGHSDRWFTPTPFVRPNDVDARFSQILCYGNLTITNRARHGKLTGRTA